MMFYSTAIKMLVDSMILFEQSEKLDNYLKICKIDSSEVNVATSYLQYSLNQSLHKQGGP